MLLAAIGAVNASAGKDRDRVGRLVSIVEAARHCRSDRSAHRHSLPRKGAAEVGGFRAAGPQLTIEGNLVLELRHLPTL